ncbi:MAG: thioredoxin domain-containing protein, partial [Burkholderiales bacterium]|nr:thioredoxin domain-containing protein [Burkholderiales bacterium]
TVPVASEGGAIPGLEIVAAAREELRRLVDAREGGLGAAPKFPHPFEFDFLLRESVRTGDGRARDLALLTLRKMADGGIYDHLGGGFCRYSVDGTWTIPHFEKMLYDNGPLLRLYADAWVITRDPLFGTVCEETAAWVIREMQAPEGGYYSSLDADSEGEEGRFYVWTPDQVRQLLSPDEYPPFAARYGLDGAPNFEGEHWHLRVARTLTEVAAATGVPEDTCAALIASARGKLFAVRGQRVWLGRDDKILTSWNAEMIEGMVHAARVFGRDDWLASARRALEFLRGTLWRDGRLMATHKDGRTHLNAYLDDHAFLLAALLEMLQADFRTDDLAWALEIADVLLDRFEDPDAGGFWFTSHDHEALILRTKPGLDNATPAGNGIAAIQLQRLGHLVGDERYLDAAERTLRLFVDSIKQHTGGSTTLVTALAEYAEPPPIVVLRGESTALDAWRRQLAGHSLPSTLVLAVPQGLSGLPAPLDRPPAPGDRVNAWVCRGVTCLAPMQRVDEVLAALGVAAN